MLKWLKRLYDDDWYAPAAIALSLFLLYHAASNNQWMFHGWPRPSVVSALFGLVFGIGKYAKLPGARWWGIPWLVLLIVATAINVHLRGWNAWGIFSVVCVSLMLPYYILVYFFPHVLNDSDDEEVDSSDGDDKPFLSLVLLFRESPYLDADVLAQLATSAWDLPVSSAEEMQIKEAETERAGFVMGEAPLFMLKHPDALLIVHHFDRPYFDDPEALAEELNELRLRNAVLEHRAWTAVDVMSWFGDDDDADAASYRVAGRLLAELADDNVLAVFLTAEHRLVVYDPETEAKLRSDNPREQLAEMYYAPVIRVSDDDPAMLAAVAEARRRWPEFVAAFENRSPEAEAPFTIKAPLGPEGAEEYIWIEVTGIEADVIYGKLANEPAAIPRLKLGDAVRVPVSKLNDWLCLINDKPVGGFTLKVISEAAKRSPPPD